ncbi:MAG: HNH endonuclease [Saprospiraceae bacterium]
MAKSNRWTREETIIAFNVYCKIPFKDSNKNHPVIIKYAKLINRSPSALNMKIGNLGRLDPELKKRSIVGLKNGSKLEEVIWKEFHGNWNALALESERLIEEFEFNSKNNLHEKETFPLGKERERTVMARLNQSFFRTTVLAAYNAQCAITGSSIVELLEASHIKAWKDDPANRLNPRNGICMNVLHHRAFDRGLFTITPNFKIKVSSILDKKDKKDDINHFIKKYDNSNLLLPDRFLPSESFLNYHQKFVFKK